MRLLQSIFSKLVGIKKWFLKRSLPIKLLIIFLLVFLGWFTIPKLIGSKTQKTQYQTSQAEKGTLIVSITASGQVATLNNASVTTETSGVVKKLYAENGQEVKSADPIAEIELDRTSQQQYTAALASYQSAKNTLEAAKSKQYSLQAAMFGKWDTFKTLAESSTYTNSDNTPNYTNRALPEFHIPEKEWLAAEADYKNQQNVITQAQTSLNSSWLSLQQSSPTIYAPISGTVTGLSLQVGSVIVGEEKIASIVTNTNPTVSVNLTQIDVSKVKIGNKVTITLDAYSGKTYTGKVISIDTVGSVSSGVTNYPTVIMLDTQNPEILPNMNASASIITQTKDDVLLVPTSAVQSQNGQVTVRVMKNGVVTQVPVETGLTSDSQIEITSGLSEGDNVVTSTTTTTNGQGNNQTQSPFGILGGNRNFGGGGAVRNQR